MHDAKEISFTKHFFINIHLVYLMSFLGYIDTVLYGQKPPKIADIKILSQSIKLMIILQFSDIFLYEDEICLVVHFLAR